MKQENKSIKYFLYARKSSREDRQIQSIVDQIKRLRIGREFEFENNKSLYEPSPPTTEQSANFADTERIKLGTLVAFCAGNKQVV